MGNMDADTQYESILRIYNDFSAYFETYAISGGGGGHRSYNAVTFTPANMYPFAIMGYNNGGTVGNMSAGKVYAYRKGTADASTVYKLYRPVQRKSDGVCGLCSTDDYTFLPMVGTNITTAAAGPIVAENPDWATHPVIKIENSYGVTLWTPYVPPILDYITLSGQTTTFTVGDTFAFGGTVTAYYSNGTTANVTNSAVIDSQSVNMSVAGIYTVYVYYTESGITESASYSIQVSAPTPQGTVTHSVAELATAHSWTNALWVNGAAFDYENATPLIYINGTNSGGASYHSPKYYSASPGTLRCYGTDVGTTLGQNYMTLELNPTKKFKKINITYTSSSTSVKLFVSDGLHDYTGTVRQQLTSGTDFDVSSMNTYRLRLYTGANSTGAGANGNTRISSITVEYE